MKELEPMLEPDVILRVSGVVAGYGASVILHGVDLIVRKNSIVTIMGPNGCGKSTLLKAIAGLVPIAEGSIHMKTRDGSASEISGCKPYEMPARGMSFVPQLENVFADMSVLENLLLGASPLRLSSRGRRMRIDEVLDDFPALQSRTGDRAGTLSGGQRQMLAMARALIPKPTLLLLDEPSAGLAPDVVDESFDKIRELSRSGVSVLIVEQKARQALAFSTFGYVLDMGVVRYQGKAEDLLHDPVVIELYLGGGGHRLEVLGDELGVEDV
jgi:branched-chain amino acid transport system ATP-binding protein/neutral amino acid transport system ATP-binding protein